MPLDVPSSRGGRGEALLVDEVERLLTARLRARSRAAVAVAEAAERIRALKRLYGGVRGYLTADVAPASLARALADILADRVSVPRGLVGSLARPGYGRGRARAGSPALRHLIA